MQYNIITQIFPLSRGFLNFSDTFFRAVLTVEFFENWIGTQKVCNKTSLPVQHGPSEEKRGETGIPFPLFRVVAYHIKFISGMLCTLFGKRRQNYLVTFAGKYVMGLEASARRAKKLGNKPCCLDVLA